MNQHAGTGAKIAVGADSEAELARGLRWLRFEPALEHEFRRDYEAQSVPSRIILTVMAMILVALTPLYDWLLLHPPQSFVPVSRFIQFGIEVPGLLLVPLCALARLRALMPSATILASLTTAGGLFAQRVIGAAHGYTVPFDFPAMVIAAVFVMGQLRFYVYFPVALFTVLAVMALEIQTFGATSAAIYNCLSLAMLAGLISTGGWIIERNARENWYRRRQLALQALHDPLTGLPNRRQFDEQLLKLVRQAAREKGNVALMVIDIDEFKAYNDRYGHPMGDAALQQVGEWLASQMRRPQDFCARIGGEEFVAVWHNAAPGDSQRLAEALRAGIGALGIPHGEGHVLTASGGFSEVIKPEPEHAARGISRDLFRRADDLLYKAKGAGRDRLVAG